MTQHFVITTATNVCHLKKILNAIEGVSIAKPEKKRKTGLDEAYEDVRAGRIYHAANVDELFERVLGK